MDYNERNEFVRDTNLKALEMITQSNHKAAKNLVDAFYDSINTWGAVDMEAVETFSMYVDQESYNDEQKEDFIAFVNDAITVITFVKNALVEKGFLLHKIDKVYVTTGLYKKLTSESRNAGDRIKEQSLEELLEELKSEMRRIN